MTKAGSASGDTCGQDEDVDFNLTFSEAMRATGTPQPTLTAGTKTRQTDYSTVMETVPKFRYRAAPGDRDTGGPGIAMDALKLNGGTITDPAGNAATLTHPALGDQPVRKLQAALQLKIKILLEGALQ